MKSTALIKVKETAHVLAPPRRDNVCESTISGDI